MYFVCISIIQNHFQYDNGLAKLQRIMGKIFRTQPFQITIKTIIVIKKQINMENMIKSTMKIKKHKRSLFRNKYNI